MGRFYDDEGRVRGLVEADRIFPAKGLNLDQILREHGINLADLKAALRNAVAIERARDVDWQEYTCQGSSRHGEALAITVRILELEGAGERGMIVDVKFHHGGW